jgi:chemotaxis protein methyltransferase CheR
VTAVVDGADATWLRRVVAETLGLALEGVSATALADLVRRRASACGLSSQAYASRLTRGVPPAEIGALAEELTVTETYFFRNIEQFHALAEVVMPDRRHARRGQSLRILSVGCASGAEPYTIAMVVRDNATDPATQVSIVGVDVNAAMLRRARAGRYPPWALRATPDAARQRWFRPAGNDLQIDERIRQSVRFVERNLVDEDRELWAPESYDVIYCRNVLMYLTPAASGRALERMARSLAPGGYLFLGHAENLRDRIDGFDLRHSHRTFYYQRTEGTPGAGRGSAAVDITRPEARADQDPGADDWVTSIASAAGRIRTLATRPPRARRVPTVTTAASPGWDRALTLLQQECYADALTVVDAMPETVRGRPDTLLLRAVLLMRTGQLAAAEEAGHRLCGLPAATASATYLLALCREGVGDTPGAVSYDRAASYLDPTFAMPHLRLGLHARRQGDVEAAGRHLGSALALLAHENPQRLLLFGDGFSRAALMALVRTELTMITGRRWAS